MYVHKFIQKYSKMSFLNNKNLLIQCDVNINLNGAKILAILRTDLFIFISYFNFIYAIVSKSINKVLL